MILKSEIISQCYNFILSKQQNIRIKTIKIEQPLNKRELFEKNLAEKQKDFTEGINLKNQKK